MADLLGCQVAVRDVMTEMGVAQHVLSYITAAQLLCSTLCLIHLEAHGSLVQREEQSLVCLGKQCVHHELRYPRK